MTPAFTTVFQYRRLIASPGLGGIGEGGGGVDSTSNIHYKAAKVMSGNDLMQHYSTELSFGL